MVDLVINNAFVIPERDLTWKAVRSGGPGGQHVNTTSTKVELRFNLLSEVLPDAVRARLCRLGKSWKVGDELIVVCQDSRSQTMNLELARAKLRGLIESALVPPKTRRKTKPSKASKRRRVENKRKLSEKKQARRRSDGD